MSTVKQEAAQLVEHLSADATWDDLMYRIYVHQKAVTGKQPAPMRGREEPSVLAGVPEGETFSQRWRGRFVPAARSAERYKALAKCRG